MEAGLAPAATSRTDFYGALAKEQQFREWVVETIDHKHNGGFQWNITTVPGVTLDVKQELLHGMRGRYPDCDFDANTDDNCNMITFLDDRALSTATSLLYPEMDMRLMETFSLHYPNACASEIRTNSWSETHVAVQSTPTCADRAGSYGETYAVAASILYFSGLIANVIMYVSWVLSPAQLDEDTTGTALTKWKTFGMPMIYLNYFMLLLAICFMFTANVYLMLNSSPYPAKAKNVYGFMYLLTIASASVLFFTGSAISFIRAKRAGMSPKTEPAAE